ncbi:MetQ/NlpA family ABC transporter substrate-binding protein [Cellulomonas marina]|uniref:D-methionine transport system substrate-binding protein n=1 Tax=Cellulomonas marina TaxID=988821 RepID=A0A1I1AA09_9CELL|nr:MetQ/NlpA family ABC transporter substrate-binding protein [Cellulomonas marina]GIG30589.1 methionine ABC transporter substrate-binding protein [Cellulomonas marina]SFB34236.1 D-methionine transport system substrate-binding protein [Cellulomonas marina]
MTLAVLPRRRALRTGALAAVAALTLAACGGGETSGAAQATTTADPENRQRVTIGVTDQSKDYWRTFEDLAAEEGIDVELVNFTDYQQPNPQLSQGQLDLNQFQHLLFLANYNVEAGEDLVAIGSTAIYQLGLYTTKGYASPDEIPDGGQVAIPNDPTNQARALLVLQSAGLVELADGGNALSTPADVLEGSRVEVVPVDANQTPVQLQSLDAAVINNNFASDAGIDPTTAIYSDLDDQSAAEPYINVFAARAEDADNPLFEQVVEIYHSPEVVQGLLDESAGTAVDVDLGADELAGILSGLEEDITAAQG